MKLINFVFAALLLSGFHAGAQTSVRQTGNITPGHAAAWTTTGVIQDAGTAASGKFSSLGVTAAGPGFCQNSGPITAAYYQLCLGVTSGGVNTISVAGFGGAGNASLQFNINGTTYPFTPGTGSGNMTGPTSPTPPAGNIAIWNGGTTVRDGGPSLFVSVLDTAIGAVCNGIADDTVALQKIMSAANTVGILPSGQTCLITSALTSTSSGNGFVCAAGPNYYAPGCNVKYTGSCGSAVNMIAFITAPNVSARLSGNYLTNLYLNGNTCAGGGLYAVGVGRFNFNGLTLAGFNGSYAVDIEPVQASMFTLAGGDTVDSQDGTLDNLYVFNASNTSGGIKLGSYSGSTGGNASYLRFKSWHVEVADSATGLLCQGCDNVDIVMSRFYGSASVASIDLSCAGTGSNLFCANGMLFDHVYAQGPIKVRGTPSFSCTAYAWPLPSTPCAFWNEFRDIDTTNNSSLPTIETGADAHYASDFGVAFGWGFFGLSGIRPALFSAESIGAINTCGANALSLGGSTTYYVCNSANGPFLYFDNLNGSRFTLRNDGASSAGDLLLESTAGTGSFIVSPPLRTNVGISPLTDGTSNIGGISLRYGVMNVEQIASNNGSANWLINFGIGASGDGNMVISHNGSTVSTFTSAGLNGALGGTTPAAVTAASLNLTGQIVSTYGTPTIASGACGTGTNGVASGANQFGTVSIGSATTTSCTISFSTTLSPAPASCVIGPANNTAASGTPAAYVSAITTGGFVITGTALATSIYHYICV